MLLGSTEMLDGAGASSSVGMSTLSPTELARLRFFAEYLVSRANEVDQSRA